MTGMKKELDMDIYMEQVEEDMNLNLNDLKEDRIEEKKCR